VFPGVFAITTVLSAKFIGRIQNRYGPNRVGIPFTKIRLCGFGQFIPDGIKSLTKEDIVPRAADKVVHFLAPVVMLIPVLLAYAVLPFGKNMTAADYDAGLLFFFAVGGAVEVSVFMAGWSSRNKYSLLGAMRAIAQMISYEIPLILSAVTVVMIVGSLNLVDIVAASKSIHLWHRALVCVHAVGLGRVHFVLHRVARGIQPHAVRFAGSGIRNHRRLFHGIFRLQVRAVFPRRIPRHVRHHRPGHHAVPRRLDRAGFVPDVGSVVSLVLCQADGDVFRFHLDSRHAAAVAHGSADELRLEIHAAAALINIVVAGIWHFMGAGWLRWLVCSPYFRRVCHSRPRPDANQKLGKRIYRYAE
jgi:hypothetical protein